MGSPPVAERALGSPATPVRDDPRPSTPIGRPGHDELGEIIVDAGRCLRRQPLLIAALSLLPAALVLAGLAAVPFLLDLLTDADLAPMQAGWVGVGVVSATIVGVCLHLRCSAVIAAVVEALGGGSEIGFGEAFRNTRGVIGRSLGVILLFGGVVMLLLAVTVWLFGPRLFGAEQLPVLPLVAAGIAVVLSWTLISARLYPLRPVFALEPQHRGLAAVGRAWRLTAGRFLRTLSTVALFGSMVWLARTIALLPLALPSATSGDLSTRLVGQLWPWTLVTVALSGIVAVCSTAFLITAQTLYHRDLVARQPVAPTLNWAPPTTAPAGGLGGGGWQPGALSGSAPAQWPNPSGWSAGQAAPPDSVVAPQHWPAPLAPQQWPAPGVPSEGATGQRQHPAGSQDWPGPQGQQQWPAPDQPRR